MAKTTETLRQQLFTMASTYQQTEQRMESLAKALARRARELNSVSETALGKVAAWDRRARAHTVAPTHTPTPP